jgi:hypothetical protein
MKHVLADWKLKRNLKLAVAVEVVVELRKERQPVHPSAELPVVEPAVVLHLEEADNLKDLSSFLSYCYKQ